jgi:hypothetical protein
MEWTELKWIERKNLFKNLLRSTFYAPAMLGILIHSQANSDSCTPASRKLLLLTTAFGQIPSLAPVAGE